MQYVSKWANGVIVTVVIATIIEMILPAGNNKKYIKTVLGLYVLYSIIGPAIEYVGKGKYSFNNILNEINEKMERNVINGEKYDINTNIEKIYRKRIEEDMINKLRNMKYDATITALSINLVTGENYGRINQVNIKINRKVEKENINSVKNVEIDVSKRETRKAISEEEKDEIRKYVSKEYDIEIDRVNVL